MEAVWLALCIDIDVLRFVLTTLLALQSVAVEPEETQTSAGAVAPTHISTFDQGPPPCEDVTVPNGALTATERNALYGSLQQSFSRCPHVAAPLLASLSCAEDSFQVVVAAAAAQAHFQSETLLARAETGLRHGDETCMRAIVPTLQHTQNPSRSMADAALRIARMPTENAHQAGWLLAGSLVPLLRLKGHEDGAVDLEQAIARALVAEASPLRRQTLLEAAGNAGSEALQPLVVRSLASADASTRRSAVAALRYSSATSKVCERLRKDSDPMVREYAAWALGFGRASTPERLACLSMAEGADADPSVRAAARQASDHLKERSLLEEEAALSFVGTNVTRYTHTVQ